MKALATLSALAATLMASMSGYGAEIPTEKTMNVVRNGEQASIMGAPGNFVGSARIDPLIAVRAPLGAGIGRHGWHGLDPAGKRRENRYQAWRCDLDATRRQTLAWRDCNDRDEPHCDPGVSGWQECGVAGACH